MSKDGGFWRQTLTPGEDAINICKMTGRDLEYCMNLIDKEAAGFQMTDSKFERSSTVGNTLSNSITCYREFFHERKRQLIPQTSMLSYFKKLPHPF